MDKLIPTVNRLQDVFNTVGQDHIDLPQIVVVGSQSSGKSSVLENLVGRDFLPRGSGIVTRRPLVLQLVNEPTDDQESGTDGEASSDEKSPGDSEQPSKNRGIARAQFLHLPHQEFTDMDEVRREIERETERLAGGNKGIIRAPIHLRITSPDVLSLTLVDLPGITKIPVGDQPSDIEAQTRDLVYEYIRKPNSIIVAISPANVDIVNSESLKIAREVDPKGLRTVGVVTKIDLMDRGTNSLDILTGRVYPLRLGFVGVVNRSQEDTLAHRPIEEALAAEGSFFRAHPIYRSAQQHCGTATLARLLNQLLLGHIRDHLPSIKTKISALISQAEHELAGFGRASDTTTTSAGRLLRMLTVFANEFSSSVEGTGGARAELAPAELCGGARLYYIFNDIFVSGLDAVRPAQSLTNSDIRTAIRNSTGPRAALFVPELAFQLLVRPLIGSLEPPAQRCVQLAYEELMKIGLSCGSSEMRRYPRLHARAMQVVSDVLRERVGPAAEYVASLISIERAYINTNHPDFIGGPGAIADLQRRMERARRARRAPAASEESTTGAEDSTAVAAEDSGASASGDHHDAKRPSSASPGASAPQSKFFNSFFGAAAHARDSLHLSDDQPRVNAVIPVPSRLANLHADGTSLDDDAASLAAQLSADLTVAEQRDELETSLIRSLIASYFAIVRKSIQDLVPKAIMHLLVNEACQNMQNRLVEELYKDNLLDDLLQEDPARVAERDQCAAMLDIYKKAFAIINEAM
ncbi:Dynamin- GTPase protein [Coemansia sp. RSA 552]|nr:Dynamin- GTPase protein [Coemansia sp. RSA 552]